MLWLHNLKPDLATTTEQNLVEAETRALLLPELTNDELLAEIQDLAAAHGKTRQRSVWMVIVGLALYVGMIVTTLEMFLTGSGFRGSVGFFFLSLLGSLVLALLVACAALRIGRSFYVRSRDRLQSIVTALVQREEPRTLPLLLDLMDMRSSGVLMWRECRTLFLEAVETLLTRMTPDLFQEFSEQQMWEILMLLYFPDGRLREVIPDVAIRCGDGRTLDALKRFHRIYGVGISAPFTQLLKLDPVLAYLQEEGVPLASAEGKAAIERALAGLTEQIEETRRTAQLLRASARDSGQAATELVRAAAPAGAVTLANQLMRPAAGVEPDTRPPSV